MWYRRTTLQHLGRLAILAGLALVPGSATSKPIDFALEVHPILKQHCYKCHSSEQSKSGLRLDLKRSAFEGGDSGKPSIVAGDAKKSYLLELVQGKSDGEVMPPKGERLNTAEISLLKTWIEEGAVWPDSFQDSSTTEPKHWAFRKPRRPDFPQVKNLRWTRNGIDPFVLAKIEQEGLAPAVEADRYALIRRVSFDLTGLPPVPAEVEQYLVDNQPAAFERMVDRYLASPSFGERWARMWLDLARYADSKGYGSDPLRPYMWRYRDWVIDSFNRNLPYDQFTIEQLAGDLLPNPTTDQLLATCFHRNTMANDEGGTDDEEFRVAAIKDRIDTTMQVWMGLTFGCAKCHSHKYDPITQKEYYSFYSFFNQTADADRPDDSPRYPTPTAQQERKLEELHTLLAPLKKERDFPTLDYSLAQARWEERAQRVDQEWTSLRPLQASALGGTGLYLQPDNSLAAVGSNPSTNTYTVEFDSLPKPVTALRLEVLPVAGGGGREHLGRGRNGTVQLTDVTLRVRAREPQFPIARFIRIEIPGKEKLLSLAEVEIFSQRTNVARRGQATQSSIDFDGDPNRAIDGNTLGEYSGKSVTHTKVSDDPWWEVDLGDPMPIEQVTVWNRTDSRLQSRLTGFRVVLLDAERTPIASHQPTTVPSPSLTIELDGTVPIKFVRATASESRSGSEAGKAIDEDAKTAWSAPQENTSRQEIVLELSKPLIVNPDEQLVLTLRQNGGEQTTLACFRVQGTYFQDPLSALPNSIRVALATPRGEQSEEERHALSSHYWTLTPEYEELSNRIRTLDDRSAAIEREVVQTPVLQELPSDHQRMTRVLLKGNFLSPGDPVRPVVPASLHGFPASLPPNRLGVAKWIMDPENPLTSRVAVNRLWSALFSRGLVESEEDFGTQGMPPSHPALLDWLATEYIRIRWDTKALVKLMVTSATYRQSSEVSTEKLRKDPRNIWLSHSPRPRLEAEMVRDQALALSGLLSPKMYGPSVYPPQPPNLWQAAFNGERTWATSSGEDKYRRGLYTFWRRTVPYPSMLTFDAPTREYCTIRRVPSNTPLQAFVTLNDPVFVEAAQGLARRILREGGTSVEARIRWGLRLVQVHPPEDRQTAALLDLYRTGLARFQQNPEAAAQMTSSHAGGDDESPDKIAEAAAWTVVANVLLNLDAVLTKG